MKRDGEEEKKINSARWDENEEVKKVSEKCVFWSKRLQYL